MHGGSITGNRSGNSGVAGNGGNGGTGGATFMNPLTPNHSLSQGGHGGNSQGSQGGNGGGVSINGASNVSRFNMYDGSITNNSTGIRGNMGAGGRGGNGGNGIFTGTLTVGGGAGWGGNVVFADASGNGAGVYVSHNPDDMNLHNSFNMFGGIINGNFTTINTNISGSVGAPGNPGTGPFPGLAGQPGQMHFGQDQGSGGGIAIGGFNHLTISANPGDSRPVISNNTAFSGGGIHINLLSPAEFDALDYYHFNLNGNDYRPEFSGNNATNGLLLNDSMDILHGRGPVRMVGFDYQTSSGPHLFNSHDIGVRGNAMMFDAGNGTFPNGDSVFVRQLPPPQPSYVVTAATTGGWPTHEWGTFRGWATTPIFDNVAGSPGNQWFTITHQPLVLHAQWRSHGRITFNGNGATTMHGVTGGGAAVSQVHFDGYSGTARTGATPVFTHPDTTLIFVGWNTNPAATTAGIVDINFPNSTATMHGVTTLYAIWRTPTEADRRAGMTFQTVPASLNFGSRPLTAAQAVHRLGTGAPADATPVASADIVMNNPLGATDWSIWASINPVPPTPTNNMASMVHVGAFPIAGAGVPIYTFDTTGGAPAATHTITWAGLMTNNRDVRVVVPAGTVPPATYTTDLVWTIVAGVPLD